MRLATRGSALALAQAELVAVALGGAEIIVVRSRDGEPGDKSRFVSAVEEALTRGEADLGVHSAKDLPGDLAEGLALVGVPGREAVEDACVGGADSLTELPEGARVGTGACAGDRSFWPCGQTCGWRIFAATSTPASSVKRTGTTRR